MAELRVSELPTAVTLDDSDLLLLSQPDANSDTGYASAKTTNVALATKIAKNTSFGDLATTSKKLIGAINELKQLIALIPQFDIEVVEQLPTEDISETTIYMVPSQNPETENAYDEFIYVDDEWEQVGSTAVDLSAYYTKLEVNGLLDLKESKADMEEDVTEILEDLSDDVTVTGNPVTFETINGGMAKSANVTFEPIQDLHGQSAPYPAGGGKNKLPFDLATIKANNTVGTWSGNTYTYDGVTWTVNDDGTYIANGTATNDVILRLIGDSSQSSSAVNLSFPTTDYKITTGFTTDGTNSTYEIGYRPAGSSGAAKHIYNNNGYVLLSTDINIIQLVVREGYTANNLKFEPMIVPSAEGDYTFAPYSNICPISGWDGLNLNVSDGETEGTDYSATFPDTVYGGTYDFVSGDGNATYSDKIKISDLTWTYLPSDPAFRADVSAKANGKANLYAECFKVVNSDVSAMNNNEITGATNSNRVYVKSTDYTTVADFLTAYGNNNIMVELATPTPFSTEPTPIELLKGTNVLWTDGDNIELVASKLANVPDLLTYIQSLEARIKALEEV